MKLPKLSISGSNVVNVVGAAIVVYLLVVLAQTVKRNYDLGKEINDRRTEISLLQDQKDQLSYNIQYYKTNAFREREAREKLGLQLPGENVVIIPHSSASPTPQPISAAKLEIPTASKTNFQQWLDFLAGKAAI